MKTTVDLSRAAQLFHALSDETRLGIIEMLRNGERCVCDLQDELDAAQSRLSFHLRVLKEAGLVSTGEKGAGPITASTRRPSPRCTTCRTPSSRPSSRSSRARLPPAVDPTIE